MTSATDGRRPRQGAIDAADAADIADIADEAAQFEVPVEEPPATVLPGGLSGIGLLVLLCGSFLPMLDFFIVNVALPTMNTTLHASAATLELVVAAYGVAYALLLVVGGRLGDAIGRRRMFVLGLAGFTISSLVCGVAPNIEVLIAARVAQGMSAAMSQPQVLATFQAALDGPKRARALGLYASVGGIAASAGQLLGGALVQANIAGSSWRPIFLVNIPVGVAALLLTRRHVPATKSPSPAGVDRRGTLLLGLTLVALLVPLTEGRVLHWPLWTWVLLALAPVFALATAIVERRTERHGGAPLLPPSLVGLATVRRGLLMALPFFVGFGAFMFVFALTVQDGLHESALGSGVVITPMAVAFFVGSLYAPRWFTRIGRWTIVIGMVLQALGLLGLVAVMTDRWPHVSGWALAGPLIVAGFGQSLGLVGLFRTVLSDVPAHLAGVGSGVLVTVQQASLALGVASLGSVYFSIEQSSPRNAFATVVGIQAAIAVLVAIAAAIRPRAEPAERVELARAVSAG